MGLLVKGFFFQFNHYFVFKKDNRNLAVPELNQHCEESPKNYRCEHCGQMIENSGTDTKHLGRNHAKVLKKKLNLQMCIAIQEPTKTLMLLKTTMMLIFFC